MNFGSKHNTLRSPKVDLHLLGRATKGKPKQFFIDWQTRYREYESKGKRDFHEEKH